MWEILSLCLSGLALALLIASFLPSSRGESGASVTNWTHSKDQTAHYRKWKTELTNTMSASPSMRSNLKTLNTKRNATKAGDKQTV